MIQELREYSRSLFFKLLMGVIAITFVLSFGVGGFFGDRKEVVARVNDSEILLKEYREAYQNRLRVFQQQFGKNAEQLAEQINLRQQVFNHLIERYLLLTDAAGLNLIATDLELQDYIKEQPYFQKNGKFDYKTYESVLSQNRIVRHEYENSLRADILLNKKKQLLVAGLVINDTEIEQAYRRNFEKIKLEYVFFDPLVFLEKTEVNENQLREYFQKHSKDFKTNNQFRVEYFKISTDSYKDSSKVKEREIRRYYKKNKNNYITPPEIKARHILFKTVPNAPEKTLLEKRKQLNILLERIKGGEPFEEIAQKYSEDGTSEDGGDLGWFKPGEMIPEFEDVAFSLETGQLSEIVHTPFGLHLIKVDDKKNKITRSLEDAREEIKLILTDSRAQKKLDEESLRLAGLAGESFLKEAQKLNKEIVNSDWIEVNSIIPGLGSASELIKELLKRKPGEMGVWKRNPVLGNVIYRLSETKKPKIKLFEEAKNEVISVVRMEKAEAIAIETAKMLFTKVKNGEKIDNIIEKHGLKLEDLEFTANTKFLPKIGENKEFRKVGLNLNENLKFGLSINSNRSHLIKFKKRILNNENEKDLKNKIKLQLLQNMQQALLNKELKRLKNSASIEVIDPLFRNPSSS